MNSSVDKRTCLGPVERLEEHVRPQWWQDVFCDNWYLKTDGDVVEDPDITKEEIRLLSSYPEIVNLLKKKGCKVLDLCCGQGRHALELIGQYPELEVCGHDQSAFLIGLAQERANGMSNKPVFTVGDCRSIPYPDESFDLILVMGNSFGYFDADQGDADVLLEILRVLSPGGQAVFDLTNGRYMKEHFASRSWEWIDSKTFVCRERGLSRDGRRLVSREVITDVDRGVIRDQFYQERLYDDHEAVDLIRSAGFSRPQVLQPNVATGKESKRQQDLGMMEYRMMIMATKKGNETEAPVAKLEEMIVSQPSLTLPHPRLVVLMGDPSISCVGKLNNSWNEEDMITRNNLKKALAQIGYLENQNMIWLEKHQDLPRDLMNLDPESGMVFNLCDEGFRNIATQELHICALLEVHHMKYTGAGPVCLAVCYDKQLTNQTAKAIGVPVPEEIYVCGNDILSQVKDPHFTRRVHDIGFPLFVKPAQGDNSYGIFTLNVVYSMEELIACLENVTLKCGIKELVIQEYLTGPEYSVGIIGNPELNDLTLMPILEVDFSRISKKQLPPILGFESKWDPTSPYWTDINFHVVNSLCSVQQNSLYDLAKQLFTRFGCRDYARFDFRTDRNGVVKLLEVNPNPGWCWDGKLNHMAHLMGWSYSKMIEMILLSAKNRLYSDVSSLSESAGDSIQDR